MISAGEGDDPIHPDRVSHAGAGPQKTPTVGRPPLRVGKVFTRHRAYEPIVEANARTAVMGEIGRRGSLGAPANGSSRVSGRTGGAVVRFPRTYLVVILVLMSSPSLAFAQFIAGNSSTVNFNSCARPQSGCPETCDLPTDGSAPRLVLRLTDAAELGDPGHEGRLHANLRAAARVANPLTCSLRLSAIHFGLQEDALGRAFADLSVTGRRAFAQFRGSLPQQASCDALPTQVPAAGCPGPATQSRPSDAELIAGCRRALERAYSVANFLRTGQSLQTNPAKEANRTSLGWIAVSGEDDQPHRPVNVPSSDFPQHDVTVVVPAPLAVQPNRPTVTVSSRFIIAQSLAPPPVVEKRVVIPTDRTERVFNPRFAQAEWTLRAEPPPRIEPNAEILIFVHGMDSRAEEATDLIKALFSRRVPSIPRNLVVIAVDLPSSGYADNLDYGVVSPLSAIGTPDGLVDFRATGETPLLDFIENFVVRFVDNLEDTVPGGVKGRIGAVIGGSLGGNISFRLGRRTDLPWLPAVVAWSPASIWNSKGEGANLIDHQVARRPWESADDRDSADPNDLGPARITRRRDFFQSWDVPILSIPRSPFSADSSGARAIGAVVEQLVAVQAVGGRDRASGAPRNLRPAFPELALAIGRGADAL